MKNLEHEVRLRVTGAGELIFGKSINAFCGNSVGFHVGVTWGDHGEAGGVISREEAKKLANHILDALNKQKPKTAEQILYTAV